MLAIEASHQEEYYVKEEACPGLAIAEVPGRILLLGEHGIVGGAYVLSTTIDKTAQVAISERTDGSLRFHACNFNERKRTTLANLKYKREDRWANHSKLAIHSFVEQGYPLRGLNCSISSEIPQQLGLASSSAIELATAMALRALFAPELSDRQLIQFLVAGQKSFSGSSPVPVDWISSLYAQENRFHIIDPVLQTLKPIEPPLKGYKIFLTDSRVPKIDMDSELKQREKELKKGLSMLAGPENTEPTYNDFIKEDLIDILSGLPEQIRRRASHVIQESARIVNIEETFKKNDIQTFGKLVYHSQEGLRDLLEVSCPEIDWLIKRSQEIDGLLCSRMAGQGFGGCIYSFIADKAIDEYRARLEEYERIFGFKPLVYEVQFGTVPKILKAEGSNANFTDK